MKILLCHERLLFRFGVDRVLIMLGKGLKDLGHTISVMGNHFDRKIVETFSSQIVEVPVCEDYFSRDEFTREWLEQNWHQHFSGASRPDIILVAGWPFFSSIPFFRQAGCKVVFSDHGVVPLQGYTGTQLRVLKKMKSLRQQHLGQASLIIGVSDFIVNSQSLVDSFGEVRVCSILNGADHLEVPIWLASHLDQGDSRIYSSDLVKSLRRQGRRTILSLGRWEPKCYKNSEAAFDIMGKVINTFPDCALLLLSDPGNTDIPPSLKNTIFPVGFPDDIELLQIMKSVDLGLCFSLWEGFNLPLAEMQWFDRPALCFSAGAHPEVVLHPWYLCRDNNEMAEKACAILSGGGLDANTKACSLAKFQAHFSWSRVIKGYANILGKVVKDDHSANQRTYRIANEPIHLVIDVTNSTKDPANSGVIRVTRRLCRELQRHQNPIFVIWDQALNDYVLPTRIEFQQLGQFNGPVLLEEMKLSPDENRVTLATLMSSLEDRPTWLIFAETVKEKDAPQARSFARHHGINLAAIFYDAIPVLYPEFCNEEIKKNHGEYIRGLAECDIVMPISDFSSRCLTQYWTDNKIPGCKVITNLLPGEFGISERNQKIQDFRREETRILCVSTLEPRKNHIKLMRACSLMEERHPDLNWSLTLVGNLYQDALEIGDFIRAAAARNPRIKWPGIVDDETLHRLYHEVSFTVYPSIIEGFGMPILESLWHGKPCICSNEGVMAELAAEGGCLTTNVSDEDALSESIYRLATDKELVLRLSREAVTRRIKTWDDYVVEFVDILRKHMKTCSHASIVAKDYAYSKWEEILYPGCLHDHWQMSDSERLALTAILYRHNPRCSIEVGTYLGGSLSLIAQHSDIVFSIDIDPSIPEKFKGFGNVSFLTGPSSVVFPLLLKGLEEAGISVDFVLIDGDHSAEAVSRDIASLLTYVPKAPLFIIIHDSFNPECRRGILSAGWEKSPYVHWVDVDFVPGRIVEHGGVGHGEMWGGLCLAYFSPEKRERGPLVNASADTMFQKLENPHRDEREVKTQEVINDHSMTREPEQLLGTFISSKELLSKKGKGTDPCEETSGFEGLIIESDCSAGELEKTIFHIQRVWSTYGEEEPFWSVLTREDFKSERCGQNIDHFYSTGEEDLANLRGFCKRNNIVLSKKSKCIEYGCGVGRVTKWFAEEFGQVIAYDISATHLRLAREFCNRKGIKNVRFGLILLLEDLDRIEKADIIYSVIVLQHNPPPLIKYILRALLNAVNKGGVALFQLPTYRQDYEFRVENYLQNLKHSKEMEMHILPQYEVIKVIEEANCRTLEVVRDQWCGEGYDSNSFFVQKNWDCS